MSKEGQLYIFELLITSFVEKIYKITINLWFNVVSKLILKDTIHQHNDYNLYLDDGIKAMRIFVLHAAALLVIINSTYHNIHFPQFILQFTTILNHY